MNIKTILAAAAVAVVSLTACNETAKTPNATRWSTEKVNEWYAPQPWLTGCNYVPCNAINQVEMWSKDTYDHAQIDKELGWAQELGFNTMRVFLSSVVYANDADGLKERMGDFLDICKSHSIKPMFVFFDDCWNPEASYGKQPEPKVGVHNSGWLRDPSMSLREDTVTLYTNLSKYVGDILTSFGKDDRILLWDLYNEPGNNGLNVKSLPLLKKVFEWARKANPSQPITAGVWNDSNEFKQLNAFQLENSDVITYHNYSGTENHGAEIRYLKMLNRPLICTEYMARTNGSKFQNIMPILKKDKVGAINWGFVKGKTNTIYQWDKPIPSGEEPNVWFHDIYRPDKTAFDKAEIDSIKKFNGL